MIRKRRRMLRWETVFWLVVPLNFLLIDRGMAQPWQLTPKLTISERYEDNVLMAEDNPETDTVTTVTPGLSLAFKEETIKVSAEYAAAVEQFARHSNLDNVGHTASFEFEKDRLFGSKTTSVSLRNTFQYLPQPLTGLEGNQGAPTVPVPSAAGIGLPRNNTWTNTAALTLTHLYSARLTERIEYLNSITRFELPTLIDSNIHEGTAEAIYQLDPNSEVSGSYRFRYFDFVQNDVDDATSHALMVGVTHRFSPTLSITIKLGPSYAIQSEQHNLTPIGMVHLSKTAEKLEIIADYSRDVSDLTGLSAQLATTQTATAGLSYAVTQKARATLSAGLADNETITGESRFRKREQKIVSWTIRSGLSYQILTWLSAEVRYYHFEQREKGLAGNNLSQDQYVLSLTGSIPWKFGGE
jgi:predicted porin